MMNPRLIQSPWGGVHYQCDIAPGIAVVSTSSHGGVWLSPERASALPAWARTVASDYCPKPTWWEEDCEAAVPILAFWSDMPEWLRERHDPAALVASLAAWRGTRAAAEGARISLGLGAAVPACD